MNFCEYVCDLPDVLVDGSAIPHTYFTDERGNEWHCFHLPRKRRSSTRRNLWLAECAMRKVFTDWKKHQCEQDGSGWYLIVTKHDDRK